MLAALLPGASSYADTAIDQHIADGFQPYADAVAGLVFAAIDLGGYAVPWILFWLIVAGLTLVFHASSEVGRSFGLEDQSDCRERRGWVFPHLRDLRF